jgi:anthranilate synthase/aminodeoxychorismate synthase-like glutamine amidotransferase
MKVLLLDNYDSFTYNLCQLLGELSAEVQVFRNDQLDMHQIRKISPDAIVISPGPGHPAIPRDFGICADVLRELSPEIPTLGVCLGHQGFAHAYGGEVIRAAHAMHGKTSLVLHDGMGIFQGLENPLVIGRYHSLIVRPESLPPQLKVTARTQEGEIMGLRHVRFPIEGVQFHPESVLTPSGVRMMANFIKQARR